MTRPTTRVAAILCTLALALPITAAAASDRVQTRDAFLSLVAGKALTTFGVSLNVLPDGQITGRAFGRQVRGVWNWQNGYFCRDLYFGNEGLGPNCQLVVLRGNALRFIADQGNGDHADLRIR